MGPAIWLTPIFDCNRGKTKGKQLKKNNKSDYKSLDPAYLRPNAV